MKIELPIVGVICCDREVEGEPAQITKHRYLEAVQLYSRSAPLLIPTNQSPHNAAAIVARLDAVLLTGSNSNIAPSRYGGTLAARQPVDDGRDAFSEALITAAIAAAKPICGVCRGLQEINVAFGGSLRDLRDDGLAAAHHAPDGVSLEQMFAFSHEIDVVKGTPLALVVGAGDLRVNSVHHQAIERLGTGLAIAATSSDGVIEAVFATARAAPVIAVQWHPEWRPEERAHDLAFWDYFGQLARGEVTDAVLDRAR